MALVKLMLEDKEGKTILYGRKLMKRRLPEIPDVRADSLCEQTRKVYEFLVSYDTVIRACRFVMSITYMVVTL
jgi:hypothetical protein